MKPYIKNRMWLVAIAIILIFVYKADFTEYASRLYSVLLPVIIAFLFAWFLLPLKKKTESFLQKSSFEFMCRFSHPISAFLIYIVFIAIIILFIICLIPIIKNSVSSIWLQFEKYKSVTERFLSSEILNNMVGKINPQVYITGAKVTVSAVVDIFMVFAILIYVLLEYKNLKKVFVNMLEFIMGNEKCEKSIYYLSKTNTIFSKYFFSKFISSLLLGIITTVGFFIAGINYPVLFGTIVALSNMIPVFGMFISTVPIAILTFAEYDFVKALIAVLIICVAQQIENNIITPKIVGDTVGLSGFWILVTTLLGGGLFGFWGLLICIPVAATLKMLFEEFVAKKRKTF